MKAKIFTVILLCCLCGSAWAQTIEGRITDERNQPLEFANIKVYTLPDTLLVTGTITDSFGVFTLNIFELSNSRTKIALGGHEFFGGVGHHSDAVIPGKILKAFFIPLYIYCRQGTYGKWRQLRFSKHIERNLFKSFGRSSPPRSGSYNECSRTDRKRTSKRLRARPYADVYTGIGIVGGKLTRRLSVYRNVGSETDLLVAQYGGRYVFYRIRIFYYETVIFRPYIDGKFIVDVGRRRNDLLRR